VRVWAEVIRYMSTHSWVWMCVSEDRRMTNPHPLARSVGFPPWESVGNSATSHTENQVKRYLHVFNIYAFSLQNNCCVEPTSNSWFSRVKEGSYEIK
jgi:hypothetical protein